MVNLTNESYARILDNQNEMIIKTAQLTQALMRAHDLVRHIEDVLPDKQFDLIDTKSWNAVTADMRA